MNVYIKQYIKQIIFSNVLFCASIYTTYKNTIIIFPLPLCCNKKKLFCLKYFNTLETFFTSLSKLKIFFLVNTGLPIFDGKRQKPAGQLVVRQVKPRENLNFREWQPDSLICRLISFHLDLQQALDVTLNLNYREPLQRTLREAANNGFLLWPAPKVLPPPSP